MVHSIRRRMQPAYSRGGQAHRTVAPPVALEQRHRVDALIEEVTPHLPDPRLRVALRRYPSGRLAAAHLTAGLVLEPPPPRSGLRDRRTNAGIRPAER